MTYQIIDGRIHYEDGTVVPAISGGRREPAPAAPAPAPSAAPTPAEAAAAAVADVPDGFAPPIPPPAAEPPAAPRPQRQPVSTPPAAPAPPAPAGPELVNVRFGGREFQLAPDVAQAYQEREREFARAITIDRERAQELETLRQNWQRVQQVIQPPQPQWQQQAQPQWQIPNGQVPQQYQDPNFATVWYQNPDQAATIVQNNAAAQAAAQVDARWRAELAERDFWDSFYRKNDHYREDDFFVKSMATRHLGELRALPTVEQRIDRLSEITGSEIMRLSRRNGNGAAPAPPLPNVPAPRAAERPSGDRLPEPTPEDQEEAALPKTLGEAIKMRRRARTAHVEGGQRGRG